MGQELGELGPAAVLAVEMEGLRDLVRRQLEAYYLKRREALLIELGWIEEALEMPRTKVPRHGERR